MHTKIQNNTNHLASFMETWRQARALREQSHPLDPDGGSFTWEGKPGTIFNTAGPMSHFKKFQRRELKAYWLREEISIADELMELAPLLRDEFLAYHTEFFDLDTPTKLKPYRNAHFDTTTVMSGLEAWLTEGVKYTWRERGTFSNRHLDDPLVRENFPTACALTTKYGDDCPIAAYSCIEPGTVIQRHTGVENRDNEFIRIHIPLIIPPGDIFFECEGVEIDWEDIWAFDNQLVHSAHNYGHARRLIFMFDVRRDKIGLPTGEKYDPVRQFRADPFIRGRYPKVLHSKQRQHG